MPKIGIQFLRKITETLLLLPLLEDMMRKARREKKIDTFTSNDLVNFKIGQQYENNDCNSDINLIYKHT